MYRSMRQITDTEREMSRVPESTLEQHVYRDLFSNMMQKLEQEGVSPESVLLRYTSFRDQMDAPFRENGYEWFTQYELNAVPLQEARALIGLER